MRIYVKDYYPTHFISDENEDLCKDTFIKNPLAHCILYDDEECDASDASVSLSSGQSITFSANDEFSGEAESVSVKKGCQLTVYTGMYILSYNHNPG